MVAWTGCWVDTMIYKPKLSIEFIELGEKYQHRIFKFDNGYGASLACSKRTYGGDEGLWELAVIVFLSEDPHDFDIVYNTPITNDVLGWLKYFDAMKIVRQKNMGLALARNAGISASATKPYDFILPLDADDWIDPGCHSYRYLNRPYPEQSRTGKDHQHEL